MDVARFQLAADMQSHAEGGNIPGPVDIFGTTSVYSPDGTRGPFFTIDLKGANSASELTRQEPIPNAWFRHNHFRTCGILFDLVSQMSDVDSEILGFIRGIWPPNFRQKMPMSQ